ncbi:MAG: hypothetical protein PVG39_17315 [Desulfobacteraceae bacterium]|jgi:hypothetical protein
MKKSILLALFFMVIIPVFTLGINQPAFAITYTKLTGGTASASSTKSGYPASQAFDSNLNTQWMATVQATYPDFGGDSLTPQWLQYQLTTSKLVTYESKVLAFMPPKAKHHPWSFCSLP